MASQDFLFYQEPVEEILRERMSHYNVLKKEIDFCLTTDLGFLKTRNLDSIQRKIANTPSAAIISLNPKFINWLGLRTQYAIKGSFVSSNTKEYSELFSLKNSVVL